MLVDLAHLRKNTESGYQTLDAHPGDICR